MALIDFLKTTAPTEKLVAALEVIREFKECESQQERLRIPFDQWVRLEELEDYLKLLTGVGKEDVRDAKASEFLEAHRRSRGDRAATGSGRNLPDGAA